MADINDTLRAAEKTAGRLLCEWPDIEIDDSWLVLDRCLSFEVDLRGTNIGYGYANVKQSVQFQRHLADMASKCWTPSELSREAQRLYDTKYNAEEQSAEFYLAQAQFRMVERIHGRHQSQPQDLVA
jgi:hypothetical protein